MYAPAAHKVARRLPCSGLAVVQAAGVLLSNHFDAEEWTGVLTAVGVESLESALRASAHRRAGAGTASTHWWRSLPAERSWVEIRRVREGLGQELRCPFVNAAGHREGWWELSHMFERRLLNWLEPAYLSGAPGATRRDGA